MLSDIFGQAIEAMRHNRRRTMITIRRHGVGHCDGGVAAGLRRGVRAGV